MLLFASAKTASEYTVGGENKKQENTELASKSKPTQLILFRQDTKHSLSQWDGNATTLFAGNKKGQRIKKLGCWTLPLKNICTMD